MEKFFNLFFAQENKKKSCNIKIYFHFFKSFGMFFFTVAQFFELVYLIIIERQLLRMKFLLSAQREICKY